MISWDYKGLHANEDEPMDNLQMTEPGATLKHDIFGLCTLLPDEPTDAGSFKVKVHEDDSVKDLTRGHFQVATGLPQARPDILPGGQGDGKEEAGYEAKHVANAAQEEDNSNAASADGSDDSKRGENKDEAGVAGGKDDEEHARNEEDSNADAGGLAETGVEPEPAPADDPSKPPPDPADEAQNSPIFAEVLQSMEQQVIKFGLDPASLSLAWYKSLLVMLDTNGVTLNCAGGSAAVARCLRVGTFVRDRATGYFFLITRIYKPLLGYLVDKDAGVVKDEDGPKHTLQLAKMSRMLGGNTGYFSGEEDSIIVCMHNKQQKYFNSVWLSCTRAALDRIFDLYPAADDIKRATAEDFEKYAADYTMEYTKLWHEDATAVAGGGTSIKNGILHGTNHLRSSWNRRKPKPYLTEAEELEAKAKAVAKAEEDKAKAAARIEESKAKAAAAKEASKKQPQPNRAQRNKRKRASSIRVDESDDGDDVVISGDENVDTQQLPPTKRARLTRTTAQPLGQTPKLTPRERQQPNQPASQQQPPCADPTPIPSAIPIAQPRCDINAPPQNGTKETAWPSMLAGRDLAADFGQPGEETAAQVSAQLPPINMPKPSLAARPDSNINQSNQQPNRAFSMHGMLNTQTGLPQQVNTAANMQQAGLPDAHSFAHQNMPHLSNPFAPSAFPQLFPQQNPQLYTRQLALAQMAAIQQAAALLPYHQMFGAIPPFPFAPFNAASVPDAMQAGSAAGASASTSPSFAAIQARISYQSKREKGLQEAQALHEYYLEKNGLPK